MGDMPIGKLLFRLSPPVMLALLIQSIYNIVDSYFVAQADGLVAGLSHPAARHRAVHRRRDRPGHPHRADGRLWGHRRPAGHHQERPVAGSVQLRPVRLRVAGRPAGVLCPLIGPAHGPAAGHPVRAGGPGRVAGAVRRVPLHQAAAGPGQHPRPHAGPGDRGRHQHRAGLHPHFRPAGRAGPRSDRRGAGYRGRPVGRHGHHPGGGVPQLRPDRPGAPAPVRRRCGSSASVSCPPASP